MSMNESTLVNERTGTDDAEQRRVELRVRERTPACVTDVIEDVTARLRRLEGDAVSDVHLKSWGPRRLDTPEEAVTSTLETYRQWANQRGYSLDPAFRRRETGSLIGQESHARLVVPVLSLAVYEDGELACVTPCTDGTTTYTVETCLEALEAGVTDLPEALGEFEQSPAGTADLERGWEPA